MEANHTSIKTQTQEILQNTTRLRTRRNTVDIVDIVTTPGKPDIILIADQAQWPRMKI